MKEKKKIEIIKGDLKIKIQYTGIFEFYGDDYDNDTMLKDEVVEGIYVIDQSGKEINLCDLASNKIRFFGPVDRGDGFNGDIQVITFGDLKSEGSLLGLLHEIGHSSVNYRNRSDEGVDDWEENLKNRRIKEERQAWGWALVKFREFLESGINLAPEFSNRKKIKDYIKESLLTHDIAERSMDIAYRKRDSNIVSGTEYWHNVKPEFLDSMIDIFFDNPQVAFDDELVPRSEVKKSFGIINK